ncbi:DUF6482 family protein [Colwelliaceae bacterium 6441]
MKDPFINHEELLMPKIIRVSDSVHYLVGATDLDNNFVGLDNTPEIVMLNSLVQAKDYLRKNNIFSATLEYQTAYDEMCGSNNNQLSSNDKICQLIRF